MPIVCTVVCHTCVLFCSVLRSRDLLLIDTLVPPVSVESQKVFALPQEILSYPFQLLSLLPQQSDLLD